MRIVTTFVAVEFSCILRGSLFLPWSPVLSVRIVIVIAFVETAVNLGAASLSTAFTRISGVEGR